MPKETTWKENFNKRFNYASFTWNGNDVTGVDFAKRTKKQVIAFISKTLQEETEKKIKEIEEILFDADISEREYKRLMDLVRNPTKS